jgi:metal-responsive CopG/Arc/MetJ family transcriptional regulator
MATKSHDRSPDKKSFSVALPKQMITELEKISKKEHRSRNGQIERFLERSIVAWREQSKSEPADLTLLGP